MSRYKTAKYGGDDEYSWAVIDKRTGQPVVTGLSRAGARSHKKDIEKL